MTRYWFSYLSLSAAILISVQIRAQQAGPVIDNYGKVYIIDNPDLPVPGEEQYHALFDVYDSPARPGGVNPQLETAARFLNMHVQAGIPVENLKVALVVHGAATEDLLKPDTYRSRNDSENQNAGLVRELIRAGVRISVCGQSATSRKIKKEQLLPGVEWALSAMTALVHYQNMGYRFIKF